MRKLFAVMLASVPALAITANSAKTREPLNHMNDSADVRDTMIKPATASGSQEIIGIEGTALRTQNDPHTTIGRLGAAVARAIAYARNAATAFTSLRRQSTPALAIAAA